MGGGVKKLCQVIIILMACWQVMINSSTLEWTDNSADDGARWTRVPNPRDAGSNYHRVTLENSVFGVAILESTVFTAEPSDFFTFSYLVTTEPSRPLSNIQVSWFGTDGRESVFADVLPDHNTPSIEWKTISKFMPVHKPTVGKIKVYGFCGNSELDTVAIDNLAVVEASCSSSSMTGSSPMTTSNEACSSDEWQSSLSTTVAMSTTVATSTESIIPTPSPNSNCPNQEDYSPCVCTNFTGPKFDVSCDGVTLEEIMKVFIRNTPTEFNVFTVVTNETTIPNNLMHSSWTYEVALNCMNGELDLIEPGAFNSSRNFMVKLDMINCSIGRVDFVFLTSFQVLGALVFRNCSGLFTSWLSLPPLSSLTSLTLVGLTQSKENISLPNNTNHIASFTMINSDLNESSTNALMDLLASSFKKTMHYVTLSGNKIHAIPPQLNLFQELRQLKVYNNPLRVLEPYALVVTSSFFQANLENCELEVVQPRFISDSFGNQMQLRLGRNSLTRMESFTFRSIFQRLYEKKGFADFSGNPLDCTDGLCRLAWIIRDHPEYLNGTVKNAACANGTLFTQLNPNWFRDECP